MSIRPEIVLSQFALAVPIISICLTVRRDRTSQHTTVILAKHEIQVKLIEVEAKVSHSLSKLGEIGDTLTDTNTLDRVCTPLKRLEQEHETIIRMQAKIDAIDVENSGIGRLHQESNDLLGRANVIVAHANNVASAVDEMFDKVVGKKAAEPIQ